MPTQKIKLVLVEDEPMMLEQYTMKLEKAGFNVVIAKDGEEGLALIKKEKPDLVLLDIILPKMDGFLVLEEIQKDAGLKKIPVILLTNLGQENDVKKGLAMGAKEYVVKANYTPTQLAEKVKELAAKFCQ